MKRCLIVLVVIAVAVALSSHAQQKPSKPAVPSKQLADDSQIYRNSTFGFRYRIPYGWVERTKAMQEGNESGRGEVLLAVFERPPEATGDTINSAVVIAAESVASYPGLKTAEDYVGPLTELTKSKGFKAVGDAVVIEIGSRRLIRADFTKPLNDKLSMHQTTLVLLQNRQIVSFTFVAGSEDEVDDLIQELSFTAPKSQAH